MGKEEATAAPLHHYLAPSVQGVFRIIIYWFSAAQLQALHV